MSPLAIQSSHAPQMLVSSDLLGTLDVDPDDVLHFPTGLLGLPGCRSFVLLATADPRLFWLQSVDHATLAFLLVDPFPFFEKYAVDLGALDLAELKAGEDAEVSVLAIVTLPRGAGDSPTCNLQGPLALHLAAGRGKQLALEGPDHGVRASISIALTSAPRAELPDPASVREIEAGLGAELGRARPYGPRSQYDSSAARPSKLLDTLG